MTERYRARPQTARARILCLEDSVISFIAPSSGGSPDPVQPICAQRWPKPRFISFLFFSRARLKKRHVGDYDLNSFFKSIFI